MFEAFAMNQVSKGMPNRMINVPGMFIRDIERSFTDASKDEQQAAIEDYYNLDEVRNAMITTTSRSSQRRVLINHWTTFESIPEEDAAVIQAAFVQIFG
jgi:hypothetical protein